MLSSLGLLALGLVSPALAQKAGSFADGGNTQVSAMMVSRRPYSTTLVANADDALVLRCLLATRRKST